MENLALREAIVHAELSKYLSSAEELIEEARNGRMFILVDDEDRENEGDLVFAAAKATPALLAFMIRHTSGVVCVPMPAKDSVVMVGWLTISHAEPLHRNHERLL